MPASPPLLTVYSREDCHLCEEMTAALRELQAPVGFALEIVDVDDDPQLAARFGADVPVLAHAGRVLCRHRLDRDCLAAYLAQIGPRGGEDEPNRC